MQIERIGEVAVLHLRGGKANAMTRELLAELGGLVDKARADEAGALVITGYESFFSGGLALPSLVGLDRGEMSRFIDFFADVMLRVLTCPLPVVAAVNGHAIAGGCVLALQCDVRVCADVPLKMGLNEVQLGIGLPAVVIEPLRLRVPASSVFPVAYEGRLFDAAQALRLGLVDELVPAGELVARAVARAGELARLPRAAYAQVKASYLRPAVQAVATFGAADREAWLDTWFTTEAQGRLRDIAARLGGGGK